MALANQTRGFTPRLEFAPCDVGFVCADTFGATWAEGESRYAALAAWHEDAERVRLMLEAEPRLHPRMLRQLRFLRAVAGEA